MRISDWSSDVCSSDLQPDRDTLGKQEPLRRLPPIGERQLPHGDGLPPPSQPFPDGIEPDLPATEQPHLDPAMQEELSTLVIGLGNRLRTPEDRKRVVKGKRVTVREEHSGPDLI